MLIMKAGSDAVTETGRLRLRLSLKKVVKVELTCNFVVRCAV